jgi:hypothetical protein
MRAAATASVVLCPVRTGAMSLPERPAPFAKSAESEEMTETRRPEITL